MHATLSFPVAHSRVVVASGATYTGSTAGATLEPSEVVVVSVNDTTPRTVWFSWSPTDYGKYTISTQGSSFDTVVAVYSGPRSSVVSAQDSEVRVPRLGIESRRCLNYYTRFDDSDVPDSSSL